MATDGAHRPERSASGRPNRVAPDGSFHAVPERGGMFGNRGQLLGRDGALARPYQVTRWIVCVLEFRGRYREQWRPDPDIKMFKAYRWGLI